MINRFIFRGVFALLFVFVSQQTFAGPMDFYIRRIIEKEQRAMMVGSADDDKSNGQLIEAVFQQKTNPQDPNDTRSFGQRYWINKTYSKKNENAPVFFYICGEATCSSSDLSGFTTDLAEKFGGVMVALEHRYYGKSQPFSTLSAENLKYLSTSNALEDLANFQKFAQAKFNLNGKWIAVGGSYAGSLSAFYRLRYPSLVAGALSSSGPVRAKADFEEYDLMVNRVAGPECAEAMRKVVVRIEEALSNPDQKLQIKKLFGAEDVKEDIDFLYVVADMAAFAVQYGSRDFLCSEILKGPDEVEAYARAGKSIFARYGITAVEDSFQGAESLDPDHYYSSFGMRQWLYQSCTEYGYWQIAHHNEQLSTRSKRIDQAYHDSVCDRLFGIKTPVDTEATNALFYEHLLNPGEASNILFTNGSNDPWSQLSISLELGNTLNPLTEALTMKGASHCEDLRSIGMSNMEVNRGQNRFFELVGTWLQ